jgi:hypothetical protein
MIDRAPASSILVPLGIEADAPTRIRWRVMLTFHFMAALGLNCVTTPRRPSVPKAPSNISAMQSAAIFADQPRAVT